MLKGDHCCQSRTAHVRRRQMKLERQCKTKTYKPTVCCLKLMTMYNNFIINKQAKFNPLVRQSKYSKRKHQGPAALLEVELIKS